VQILGLTALVFTVTAGPPLGAPAAVTNPSSPQPDFQSRHLAVGFFRTVPAFTMFTMSDSRQLPNEAELETAAIPCAKETLCKTTFKEQAGVTVFGSEGRFS